MTPRYEVGSVSGLPGPNVAVCASNERTDIAKRTVVPCATVLTSGSIPKYSTPPFAEPPTDTLFAPGTTFLSFLARLRAAASCFLTAFLSFFALGTFACAPLTTTRPIMPGWMSQKYVNVPFLVNLTVTGFGVAASGRPDSIRALPWRLNDLPKLSTSRAGLNCWLPWPLNQNGAPFASVAFVI